MALREGKHVFCEKPLTHSIFEARKIAEAVRGTNLATQMGNEAHSGPNYRQALALKATDELLDQLEAQGVEKRLRCLWVGLFEQG